MLPLTCTGGPCCVIDDQLGWWAYYHIVMDQPVLPRPYQGGTYRGGWHPSQEWDWGTEGARVSLRVLEGAGF